MPYFMLIVVERKFVVTKTNIADDPSNRRNEKDRKLEVFVQLGHLRVLINFCCDLLAEHTPCDSQSSFIPFTS